MVEMTRRTFLGAVGAAGVAGAAGLAPVLPKRQIARSVVEIWLMGGPSHLETFDPKPDAGFEYANGLKAIDTNVPGMQLHQWLPKLAQCADLFSIVRSMTHKQFGHESAVYLMQTGREPGGGIIYPAIGAVIAMLKQKEYKGDLPPFVILTAAKGRFSEVGFLGERYAPLVTGGNPNASRFVVDGIVPAGGISEEEIRQRFTLAERLDGFGRALAGNPLLAHFDDVGLEARRVMTGNAARTFDLTTEDKSVRDAYGRTVFGQSLLAARRLVEYGVPYVTVNLTGWDSHKRHFETMVHRTAELDQGLSAFLKDLRARGLLDATLVWCSGEFGRTPRISRQAPWNGGRNHWARCFSALVAGGGFAGGRVVGASDALGESPAVRPVSPVDFLGSIYERCGIDPSARMPNPRNLDVSILPTSDPQSRLRELYV